MSQRKITAEIVEEARRLRGPPEELGVREIAARLGVGRSQLAAAMGPPPQREPRKPEGPPGPRPAPAMAHPVAPAPAAKAAPAKVERLPPPPPATLDADPVVELLKVAAELRGRMAGQPAGSKEFRDLSGELRKTLAQAEALRAKRQALRPAGDGGARAEEVAAKIRSGVRAVAQREAEEGACSRCGCALAPELVLRRRIEAGLVDPPAVH